MKNIVLTSVLFLFLLTCRPEEEQLTYDRNAQLTFSEDTVLFDTVFTRVSEEIRNITRRLKVYNNSKYAVEIKEISLKKEDSPYTIFVNGRRADTFHDIRLLGKDSILILVEVNIDPMDKDLPFIVTDEMGFITNGNHQQVKLVSWGQDAHFLQDSILRCNATWTAERPYVLYKSVMVDTLCTLTIEPGTEIYAYHGAYCLVKGTLKVNGEADNRVVFRNQRRDLEHVPGQWGGIIFLPGSKGNLINHADIRNAEAGIYLGTPDDNTTPDLVLSNVIIENIGGNTEFAVKGGVVMPGYGIFAVSSDLYAYNTLVNNCAINTVGNYAGGNYRYEHCTFVNYAFDFFREEPSVVFSDNLIVNDREMITANLNLQMHNTIIWGNMSDEILLTNAGGANFTVEMSHNLLRTENETLDVNNNIINTDPRFVNPRAYDYSLDSLSPARDHGEKSDITTDLEGNPRDAEPDIGAYEKTAN